MLTRRLFLGGLLAGGAGVLGLGLVHRFRGPENYSLIEDRLYLGGFVREPPPGTRAVLNLCRVADPYQSDIDAYLWKPIPDNDQVPSISWLREVVDFLDGALRSEVTTYVHCRNGVSRGGMVVTAYEMFKHHWSRDRALEFVRMKREQVRPNPAFLRLLRKWEKACSVPGATAPS
jgi:protein-tyrosine phosphatase